MKPTYSKEAREIPKNTCEHRKLGIYIFTNQLL